LGGFGGFNSIQSLASSAVGGVAAGIVAPQPAVQPQLPQSSTGQMKEPERVRMVFPETWLWTNKTIGYHIYQIFEQIVSCLSCELHTIPSFQLNSPPTKLLHYSVFL